MNLKEISSEIIRSLMFRAVMVCSDVQQQAAYHYYYHHYYYRHYYYHYYYNRCLLTALAGFSWK